MSKASYTVLITASGVGVPLGNLTQYTNKALIKVGKRPTLSYIIDNYPKDTKFVITLGHYAKHVRDFISIAYPKLNVTFVAIDTYSGPGSSLAYTMIKASKHLQEPFIYHASDTIVTDKPAKVDQNWIAGFPGSSSSNYASFNVLDGIVEAVHEKGMLNPDYLHIGWVGIKDYKNFWETARRLLRENPADETLGDAQIIGKLVSSGIPFRNIPVRKWYDVGNVESLNRVRHDIEDSFHILDKPTESIYFLNGKVTKFFHDAKTAKERIARARILHGIVPKVVDTKENFYSYRHVDGDLLSEIAQPQILLELLVWAEKKLWQPVQETSHKKFQDICAKFYQDKTYERIEEFLSSRNITDKKITINGNHVPPVRNLLEKVDFTLLTNADQTHFHGDFVLDNILKTKTGFCLLDWRQNFGGLLKAGDKYYDLAKLNHNLTVNHGIVNRKQFSVTVTKNSVMCEIMRKESLVQCQKELFSYLEANGYDSKKVRLLTAIIWLNMAPLHEHPFDVFLYYFGRLNLWYALRDEKGVR